MLISKSKIENYPLEEEYEGFILAFIDGAWLVKIPERAGDFAGGFNSLSQAKELVDNYLRK